MFNKRALAAIMDRDEPYFGRKIAEFKPNFTSFILSLLAGVILLVLGLYTGTQALFLQQEIEMIDVLLPFLLFYLGVVLGWFAYRRFTALGTSYTLYEQGVQRLDGTEEKSMTWDQVKIVKRESRTIAANPQRLTQAGRNRWRTWALIGEDGKSLAISDQPRLAAMIVGMLLVHDWPPIQRRIENGEKVSLSRMLVSKEGLEYKGYLIPWSRINKAETTDHIKLYTISGRINWPEINNRDHDDVLGYLMLQRVIEYYLLRE
jgi:hypothetical protein